MSLNFFCQKCQYPPITLHLFGLCDNEDGKKAFPDTENQDIWIATVRNNNNLSIVFTAIDKCVLHDHEFKGRGRCDGMLTTENLLYLVELKNQNPPWQSDAIEQLKSTIQFIREKHDISRFKKLKAFACNKKRPKFVEIDNEKNKKLFRETGFRFDIQAEIIII
jgi:hypothetical protein